MCWMRIEQAESIFSFLYLRIHDVSRSGFNDWPFMTVHQWEESPQGVWELEIHNKGRYMGKSKVDDNLYQLLYCLGVKDNFK